MSLFKRKEKIPTKDFTPADMPDTRYEKFVDVFKNRLLGLLTLNGMYLVFMLPVVIFLFLFLVSVSQQVAAGSALDEYAGYLAYTVPIAGLLYALTGPAKAGYFYVLRNWCWSQPADVWRDFWREWKRSWAKALGVQLLMAGFVNAVYFWGMTLFYTETLNRTVSMLLFGVLILFTLLVFAANLFVFPLLVTYKLTFKQLLKNSFVLALARLPKALVFLAGSILFLALTAYLWQGLMLLFALFGFSALFLANTLFAQAAFDKYSAALTDEPVKLRRGLSPKPEARAKGKK